MTDRHHLAEINIARFRLPITDPANAEFLANLDRVNALAESSPGFVWRLKGEGNDATSLRLYGDPQVIPNMSVWSDLESLVAFTYRNSVHLEIMRRRKEWFEKLEFYMVLWWVPEGQLPTLDEAVERLDILRRKGPTVDAFTFSTPFGPPGSGEIDPVLDRCA